MNCPKCGNLIETNKKFCPKCGYSLEINKTSNEKPTSSINSNIITVIAVVITSVIIIAFVIAYGIYKASLKEQKRNALKRTMATITTCTSLTLNGEKKKYTNPDDIIYKGIVPKLELKEQNGNKFVLADGTTVTYRKLKDNCSLKERTFESKTACYELEIEPDIKFLNSIKFKNDQETFHIYGHWLGATPDSGSKEMRMYQNLE